MNNYNNDALNQLYNVLKIIRAQMATSQHQPYFHFDDSYIDLNLKLLISIGINNNLPTDKLETALNQFSLNDNYEYNNGLFSHIESDTNDEESNSYPESQWTLTDLNQIVGMLTPINN